MSPTPVPPTVDISQLSSTDPNADGIRKRVCKACDRCRLKKSKCDGSHPCSRCKADNAICVFGERKKSHDKVYPKGYVEMLEQQQSQLVSGLQEMYNRLLNAQLWNAPVLSETNGHPLTHDILAALGLLEPKQDGSGNMEAFEDDCQKLQTRLLAEGAGYVQRRGSFSSDSERSLQHAPARSRSTPTTNTTITSPTFKDGLHFSSTSSPSPLSMSPAPRQRQSYPPAVLPPPLQRTSSPLVNDPQLYQTTWAVPSHNHPEALLRSKYAMQSPQLQTSLDDVEDMLAAAQWDESPSTTSPFTLSLNSGLSSPYPQQVSSGLGMMPDFGLNFQDSMDVDFNRYIQVTT